jgi:hypothetical protein
LQEKIEIIIKMNRYFFIMFLFLSVFQKTVCQRFAACRSGGLRKPKLSVKH